MTAYASVNTAVEALKSGAYDYLTKPLDIDELKILIAKALRFRQLEEENRYRKTYDNANRETAPNSIASIPIERQQN